MGKKMLHHGMSADTLRCIGLDREHMDGAFLDLNLGLQGRPGGDEGQPPRASRSRSPPRGAGKGLAAWNPPPIWS